MDETENPDMESAEQKSKSKRKLNNMWNFFVHNKVEDVDSKNTKDRENDLNKHLSEIEKEDLKRNGDVQKASMDKEETDRLSEKDSVILDSEKVNEIGLNMPDSVNMYETIIPDKDTANGSLGSGERSIKKEYGTQNRDDQRHDDVGDNEDNTRKEYQNILSRLASRTTQSNIEDPTADVISAMKRGMNTLFI